MLYFSNKNKEIIKSKKWRKKSELEPPFIHTTVALLLRFLDTEALILKPV